MHFLFHNIFVLFLFLIVYSYDLKNFLESFLNYYI